MADYKLWGRAGWGSTIVEAQLVWYGLPYTFEAVEDLFRTPDADAKLRKVNPLAQVPTSRCPTAAIMSESAAITLLLADITGKDSLVPPANARERAQVPALAGVHRRQHLSDLHLCRRSGALRLGQCRARSLPRRHRRLCPAAVAPDRERGGQPVVPGRALLRPRHLHRHHDPLAAQARLVRERDASPFRHRPPRRPVPELGEVWKRNFPSG